MNSTVLNIQMPNRVETRDSEVLLPSPESLRDQYALAPERREDLSLARRRVNDIVAGRHPRLLVVVGPCSIHDPEATLEYGSRLAACLPRFQDRLEIVMRAYVEKPRTTIGWKGLVYDPHLDGRHDLETGLNLSRRLMRDLVTMGLPLATEALSPMVSDYLQDLVCWTAIGARTTESQTHREMASGLDSAVGFKNGTDGGIEVAVQAMLSARSSHVFPAISYCGRPSVRTTAGNPHLHLVLRGGRKGPNYDPLSIALAKEKLQESGLTASIMVDCSHDNSRKDYRQQARVVSDLLPAIREGEVMGVMLESYLNPGKQPMACPLEYGVSVTDGCIGWEETLALLEALYDASGRSETRS